MDRNNCPRGKLADLLQSTVYLQEEVARPTKPQVLRACSSAALLGAMATKSMCEKENHVAQIEAWVMYAASVFAAAERWQLAQRDWEASIDLAVAAILNTLDNLIDELRRRAHLVEGDILTDVPFRPARVTYLLALVSVRVMWHRLGGTLDVDTADFAQAFCSRYRHQLRMWGEGAVPQLLAFYWYWRTVDPTPESDFFLARMIEGICRRNGPNADAGGALANPYVSVNDAISQQVGLGEGGADEEFRRNSYTLEALGHLFVRQNWRQRMKEMWPDVTRIWFNRFDPSGKWRYFLWRTDEGKHWSVCPTFPKRWSELRDEAMEQQGDGLPRSIRALPLLLLLFLCVFPHRLNAEGVRWLDGKLSQL